MADTSWRAIQKKASCYLPTNPEVTQEFKEAVESMYRQLAVDGTFMPAWLVTRLLSPGWCEQARLTSGSVREKRWFASWRTLVQDRVMGRLEERQGDRACGLTRILARIIACDPFFEDPATISHVKPGSRSNSGTTRSLDRRFQNWLRRASRRDDHSPATLIGPTWSAPGSFCSAIGPPDPCVVPIIQPLALSLANDDHRLVGSSSGDNAPKKERSAQGDFFESTVGRLPENPARLSPIELLYLRAIPEFFLQRMANNSLNQRFGHHSVYSKVRPRILMELALFESEELHTWPRGKPHAPVSFARAILCGLFHLLNSLGSTLNLDCHFRFQWKGPVDGSGQSTTGVLEGLRPSRTIEKSYLQLRGLIPEALSLHAHCSELRSAPDSDDHRSYDSFIRVLISDVKEVRHATKQKTPKATGPSFEIQVGLNGLRTRVTQGRRMTQGGVHDEKPKQHSLEDVLRTVLGFVSLPLSSALHPEHRATPYLETQ